jgi:hypothetical protein
MRKRFLAAQNGKGNAETALAALETERRSLDQKMTQNVTCAKDCLNELRAIAAHPDPLSEMDYINMLIQAEEEGMESGWQQRVQHRRNSRED